MSDNESKIYHVARAVAGEHDWEACTTLSDFGFPWLTCDAPMSRFQAFWTDEDERLVFRFDIDDDDIVLGEGENARQKVIASDRVELFFAVDADLSRYYCLEMDPRGVVFDYAAQYHRNMDWDWSIDDLELDTEIRPGGYWVEGSLSLGELTGLGCVHPRADGSRELIVGIYRAEFHCDENGEVIQDWISWIDPKTEVPDFHVPTSFGRLVLCC